MLINNETRVIHDNDPSPRCNNLINKRVLTEDDAAILVEKGKARYCKFCFVHGPTILHSVTTGRVSYRTYDA